jgi:23S rRNA-/tRNA-specific pseudouridylate synthase
MIIGLSSTRAHTLSQEFVQGEVKKEYIARCSGEFPGEEVVVEQPLLTVDRQMGLNIVHPQGKVRSCITFLLSHGDSRRLQRRCSNGCTTTEAPTRACFTVSDLRSSLFRIVDCEPTTQPL